MRYKFSLFYPFTLDCSPAEGELYPEVLELAGEELLFRGSSVSPPPLVFPLRSGLLGACLSKKYDEEPILKKR
jgi:hypothetical protein